MAVVNIKMDTFKATDTLYRPREAVTMMIENCLIKLSFLSDSSHDNCFLLEIEHHQYLIPTSTIKTGKINSIEMLSQEIKTQLTLGRLTLAKLIHSAKFNHTKPKEKLTRNNGQFMTITNQGVFLICEKIPKHAAYQKKSQTHRVVQSTYETCKNK